jgi:tetratricopeptide (TPR) repeat protein
MPRPLHGALLCAALVPACRNPQPTRPGAELALTTEPGPSLEAGQAAEAIRSLEEGQYEHARELLDGLLIEGYLARARAELAAGVPEDALTALDEALALAPHDPEVRLLQADASLRLAEAKLRSGGGGVLIEGALGDALAAYRSLPESAHALFGASRAAWLLGQGDEALVLARRGLALRRSGGELTTLALAPERIYAEQVHAAYGRARAAGAASDAEARALFLECEDALGKVIGQSCDEPWAWATLADLYEGDGRLADAQATLERGLQLAPEDAGLIERLARVGSALAGPAVAVRALEAHLASHGEISAARWQLCVARFDSALAGYESEPPALDPAPFDAIEAEFASLRVRQPERASEALGYEVVARLARGWCAFQAGDLTRARAEFLAMDELFPRGIEWSVDGRLESGIQGLSRVADAHAARDELQSAGEVFETLHELQPGAARWPERAGYFLREAAFALELEGKSLCRAARGRVSNAEALSELRALANIGPVAPAGAPEAIPAEDARAFARAADDRFARARALMERSWLAYRPAAELAPEDVRVVGDAALVQVYYLHHELGWAEQALLGCVERGAREVEALETELAAEIAAGAAPDRKAALEEQLDRLKEAWGDAHQSLGVLAWIHRKDAAAARTWLDRSVEIGPARQPVTNSLLPQVRGELAPREDDTWDLLRWAEPCQAR